MIEIAVKKELHGADGAINLHFETSIQPGELVTIYGSSGAGKTSILRMLAGLLNPDTGVIRCKGLVWFDKDRKINVKPQARGIGMVFQDYSLFPNMTVRENLEFALDKTQDKGVVDELLLLTELTGLSGRRPSVLSGGQKQRVALARALVRKPKLLLLDEPFSALDVEMQSKLQDYILQAHREFGLTTLLISHDILEVVKMSRRVIVLKDGKIDKEGSPEDVLPLAGLREFFEKNFR